MTTQIPWNAVDHWQEIQQLIKAEVASYALRIGTVTAVEGKQVRVRLQGDTSGGPYGLYSVVSPFLPSVGDIVHMERLQGGGLVCMGSTLLNASDPVDLPANAPIRLPSIRFASGIQLLSDVGDPNGVVFAERGSYYLRDNITANGAERFYLKTTQIGSSFGWVRLDRIARRNTKREVITYPGASTLTSFVNIGFKTGPTAAGTASNGDTTLGDFLQLTTSSTINTSASIKGGTDDGFRPDREPLLSFGTRTPATITTIRAWWGAFDGDPSASGDPALNGAGFRFDSALGDTTFKCWTNDGSGGGTITDSGQSVSTNVAWDMRMEFTTGYVDFFLDGTWVARNTTNLPTSSTLLTWGQYVTCLAGSATRTTRFGRVTIESRP